MTVLAAPAGSSAGAKQGGAEADHRRPLLHRDLPVGAHPHGQGVEDDPVSAERVEQPSQCPEVRAGVLGPLRLWREGHQSPQPEVGQGHDHPGERRDFLRENPGLLRLATHVHLEEHRQWIEKMTERCGINHNLPLWLMEERAVSEELIKRGGKALIVAIRSDLVDQKWLGRIMDHNYIEYCVSIGISPCGEGGEAHTLVVDGPGFVQPLDYQAGSTKTKESHSRLELLVD